MYRYRATVEFPFIDVLTVPFYFIHIQFIEYNKRFMETKFHSHIPVVTLATPKSSSLFLILSMLSSFGCGNRLLLVRHFSCSMFVVCFFVMNLLGYFSYSEEVIHPITQSATVVSVSTIVHLPLKA